MHLWPLGFGLLTLESTHSALEMSCGVSGRFSAKKKSKPQLPIPSPLTKFTGSIRPFLEAGFTRKSPRVRLEKSPPRSLMSMGPVYLQPVPHLVI